MQFLAVNWLAVLVAAVINMVVGFLWYGPLFSGLFLRLIGKREEEIEGSPIVYVLGVVMGLVTTYGPRAEVRCRLPSQPADSVARPRVMRPATRPLPPRAARVMG